MFDEFLIKAGLNKEQSGVYGALLEVGAMSARKIALKLGLKRGITYKILDQLIEQGLVEKNEKLSKIALFFPTHPGKIKELLEKKTQELKTAEGALQGVMGQMVSSFNLISGKPNVQFFEGIDGLTVAGSDSLTSATEIYQYIDNEAVAKKIPEFNEDYIKKRQKFNIKKKMLCVDSPFIRDRAKDFDPAITEVRVIPSTSFSTVMQIYDNKVSYITLDREKMMGIIIESPEIYLMHKTLFENMWQSATPLTQKEVPEIPETPSQMA